MHIDRARAIVQHQRRRTRRNQAAGKIKRRAKDLIKVSGLSVDEFLLLNPELSKITRQNLSVPAGFRVHVPEHVRPSIERLLAGTGKDKGRKLADGSGEAS